MINTPSRLPQRLLTVAALTVAIAISGCQKEPDTNTATNTQNNNKTINTKTAEPQNPEAKQQVAPLTILALGDSLTEGLGVDNNANYPSQLQARLQELGYKNVAMALTDRSVSIDDEALMSEDKLAIILGTEGDGLCQETIDACDYTVKIPMAHGVDSLNVAAASAVAFWQLAKRK